MGNQNTIQILSRLAWAVSKEFKPARSFFNRFIWPWVLPKNEVTVAWDAQFILVRNPRSSLIGKSIWLTGCWEPEVTTFICERIGPGMTILDVGADIGYYTLLFAKRVGETGRVIAFEPIPSARDKIEENIHLNKYHNVAVCEKALFSGSGKAVLEDPFRLSRLNTGKKVSEGNDIEIQMVTFDEYGPFLELSRLDLVKIDVEGAEVDVLMGMQKTINAYRPSLLIEIHPSQIEHFGHSVEKLLDFIKNIGYSYVPVDKKTIQSSDDNVTVYCTSAEGASARKTDERVPEGPF